MWIFEAWPLLGEIRYSAELNMNSVTDVFPEIFKKIFRKAFSKITDGMLLILSDCSLKMSRTPFKPSISDGNKRSYILKHT